MYKDDSPKLDGDEIRQPIENAEPPPGTMAWAEMTIHRYEAQIAGTGADITKVYKLPYVVAAATFSIEDGGRYERLRNMLKSRGVNITNWERHVREAEHKIRDERKAEARGAAQQQARARKVPSSAAAPVWTPLESKCQQPVNGKDLLRDLRNAIRKFVWLEEAQAIVAALWVLFTWVFEKCAETNPYLRILSPEPNCGKSTLLKVLRHLTRAGWLIANSTKSSFVRKAQTGRFTLLIDEGDAFLQENEEMRNILDAASDPDTANVSLSDKPGKAWVSTDINVFIPIAVGSIKKLRRMETAEQRSIHLWLKRATRAERSTLTKARHRTLKQTLEPIADRCARWAQDNAGRLAGMRPAMDFEDGRDEDKWEPLVGLADCVDAQLGKRVRKIAADMIGKSATDAQSLQILLLADIKQLFERKREQKEPNADKFASQALCDALAAMPDRPWQALPAGKGREPRLITQNRLASMLRDFNIRPRKIRIGALTLNGYERKDFEDAWQRYATNQASEEDEEGQKPDNDPSQNSESTNFGDPEWNNGTTLGGVSESGVFRLEQEDPCSGSKKGTFPYAEKDCAGVPDQNSKNTDFSFHAPHTCPLGCDSSTGCQAPDACSDAERFTVGGGIPAFATKKTKAALRKRGYTDEQIAKMRPAEALRVPRSVSPEAVQPCDGEAGDAKTPRLSGEGTG